MGFTDFFRIKQIKQENEQLKEQLLNAQKQLDEIGCTDYVHTKEKISNMLNECQRTISNLEAESAQKISAAQDTLTKANKVISDNNGIIASLNERINVLREENEKLNKQINTQQKKLSKCRELYKSIEYSVNNFHSSGAFADGNFQANSVSLDELSPSIILKLHCMDVKDLRKAFRENDRQIDSVLSSYSARYSTKGNRAIYELMVIALRAELQNILYNLKYEKLDQGIENVKTVCQKYLSIAGNGNQSIAGTLTKFIGEIEYLFINSVKIEYNYYVKKEQARQEQLAIREQMRQEAEERKALEAERKKIEKEEDKYKQEIERIKEQLKNAADSEIEKLKSQIVSLQSSLSDVVIKKEEVTSLQNGKAGNVYIISNLGSFGENVFKIGMTRRIDPQDRVNELGDASVPFKFDVHSFIFSEDAVGLESKLHQILNHKRVNKVNLRKEFFYTNIDELENIVTEIDPTAEFNRTMLAEEFRQSQSTDDMYTSDYITDDDNE